LIQIEVLQDVQDNEASATNNESEVDTEADADQDQDQEKIEIESESQEDNVIETEEISVVELETPSE